MVGNKNISHMIAQKGRREKGCNSFVGNLYEYNSLKQIKTTFGVKKYLNGNQIILSNKPGI